jgi:D-alanyl-D-alanine carboxypeptidase
MSSKLSIGIKIAVALSIAVLIGILVIGALARSTNTADNDTAGQINQLLTDTFKPDEPGAAVIVVRDGQVILRKGYGMANLELGVPVAPEMVFRLGSITKQFTAVAILMLVDEGRVTLSDDITKFLPSFPTHGQAITIERLLTHTAGIKNYTEMPEFPSWWRDDRSLDELIGLFKDQPLDFAPGEKWAYSDSGYVLLGAVIEKASGTSYAEFIQQRIFGPLGMAHSYYDATEQVVPGRVAGYARTQAGYAHAAYLSMTLPYAAGSLAASVDDLARWDAALYTDKLVKQATLKRAFQPAILNHGQPTGYGFGWEIGGYEGHSFSEHNGGINGFSTQMIRLSEDNVYVAILTNCENCRGSLGALAFRIAATAIGKPYHDPPAIALPAATLAAYEGVYQLNEHTSLTIGRQDDHLVLQAGAARTLEPLSASEFFIKDALVRIRFVKDASGAVTGLQLQNHFGPWHGAQKIDQGGNNA